MKHLTPRNAALVIALGWFLFLIGWPAAGITLVVVATLVAATNVAHAVALRGPKVDPTRRTLNTGQVNRRV